MKALQFIHADAPILDLEQCSALSYAQTAHFLDIKRLQHEVIICASNVIHGMSNQEDDAIGKKNESKPCLQDNEGNKPSKENNPCDAADGCISPWDAIAVLTLLGDPQQALPLVNLRQWYKR